MDLCCPYCKRNAIIKKGKRKEKQGIQQKYYCTWCRKTFIHRLCKHKTYSAEVIREALTYYNTGYTYEETTRMLNKRFKTHVTKSSIHRWTHEYQDICTFAALRTKMRKQYGKQCVASKTFEHQGLAYNFKYHRGKLEVLGSTYPSLVSFIRRCCSGCPPFFSDIKHRCSQFGVDVTVEKTVSLANNLVCRQAALAVCNAPTKKSRHSLVENFMLINDDATVAVEVPVWLWEKKLNLSIAGHIDIIQIHSGSVYILDYKPESAHENERQVTSQLYLYASGLCFRTSIPLNRIKCAWFDDTTYYEFEPAQAAVQYTKNGF